jgi:hypothetical protein
MAWGSGVAFAALASAYAQSNVAELHHIHQIFGAAHGNRILPYCV